VSPGSGQGRLAVGGQAARAETDSGVGAHSAAQRRDSHAQRRSESRAARAEGAAGGPLPSQGGNLGS
jgi:hypothetical protein